MPVTNSNSAPPTSRASDSRSSAWAGLRTGGHSNSRGMTDHSLASRTGNSARPTVDVQPLGQRVQPRRPRRPAEQVEVQRAARWRPSALPPEARLVGVVGQQPGDDHDREADQQDQAEDGGQPRAPQGAAPEPGTKRAGRRVRRVQMRRAARGQADTRRRCRPSRRGVKRCSRTPTAVIADLPSPQIAGRVQFSVIAGGLA